MHNNENQFILQGFLRIINQFLPVLFWITLILGFEEPSVACLTILSALIHEFGHIAYLKLRGHGKAKLRGVLSGFRIAPSTQLTYAEETMLYLSGPLANVCAAMLCSLFQGEWASLLCTLNVATAVSNLLPVEGYDGYGALRSLAERRNPIGIGTRLLDITSSAIIFSFCILSIYFIDRFGEGYWIFAVFFVSMIRQLDKWLKIQNP